MSDNQNPEKNVSSEDKDSEEKEMIAKKLAEKEANRQKSQKK